jgi:uncharacterized membrane protein
MLKVDILNIMGPAMVLAATVWALSTRLWIRVVLLAIVASAFSFLTPWVRATAWLAPIPDWLEAYLRPPQGRSWFALFPWAGLLVAGTIVGELINRTRDAETERRLVGGLALGGSLLFAVALAGSYLPSPFAGTYFWTTSPAYFFLRIGLMTAMLAGAWAWCRRRRPGRFSPLLQFGHTSLFIYWIHVEMVYGYLTWPIHRALPLPAAFAAFVAFTLLMLWVSVAKERVVARWRARQAGAPAPA